jgi:hypothetical protein
MPSGGERLICELGGFPDQVRRLVLHHHERLDRAAILEVLLAHSRQGPGITPIAA